jgi:hypothetical protein
MPSNNVVFSLPEETSIADTQPSIQLKNAVHIEAESLYLAHSLTRVSGYCVAILSERTRS